MIHLLIPLYYSTLGLLILHIAATLLGIRKYEILFQAIILGFSFTSVVMMAITSGHLPVSGDFEKLQCMVFYILLFSTLNNIALSTTRIRFYSFFSLIILAIPLLGELQTSEHYIIYDHFEVVLFFQLRTLSMAFFALSVTCSIEAFFAKQMNNSEQNLIHLARNYGLLGAAAFLGGEFFGSLWALYGWGDPWRWSRGFFMAGAMFLLSMIAGHIPPAYLKNSNAKIILPAIPFLIILVFFLS